MIIHHICRLMLPDKMIGLILCFLFNAVKSTSKHNWLPCWHPVNWCCIQWNGVGWTKLWFAIFSIVRFSFASTLLQIWFWLSIDCWDNAIVIIHHCNHDHWFQYRNIHSTFSWLYLLWNFCSFWNCVWDFDSKLFFVLHLSSIFCFWIDHFVSYSSFQHVARVFTYECIWHMPLSHQLSISNAFLDRRDSFCRNFFCLCKVWWIDRYKSNDIFGIFESTLLFIVQDFDGSFRCTLLVCCLVLQDFDGSTRFTLLVILLFTLFVGHSFGFTQWSFGVICLTLNRVDDPTTLLVINSGGSTE